MAGFQVKKHSEDFGEDVTLELMCADRDTQAFARALTELSSGGIHFDIGDIIFADMGEGKQ
jgi:putative IMPACT (imprinted ancient) family translation regulator